MRTLLLTACMVASVAWSAPGEVDVPYLNVSQGASKAPASKAADDDEDDPAPGAKKTDEKKTDQKKDGAATGSSDTLVPAAADTKDQKLAQTLVSGAPIYNPNVAVHIVEQKQFSDDSKRELILFPAATQVNGKFTQHYGTSLGAVWHVHENFGFQLQGQWNWYSTESAFSSELVAKVREEAQAATSLLLTWGAIGGVEVTPLYGKFAWFDNTLAHFSVVLSGGAGLGGTRHQLKPENTPTMSNPSCNDNVTLGCPTTYGDTGLRFLGELGGGFRLQIGKRFALRVELRDLVYTARVDSVNGCGQEDMAILNMQTRGGEKNISTLQSKVSSSCRVVAFSDPADVDADGNKKNEKIGTDISLANSLVETPSSDVLNNLGLYIGASFIF